VVFWCREKYRHDESVIKPRPRPELHDEGGTMDIKRLVSVPDHSTFADLALLFLRVVAGLAFMLHGWGKIQNPFGWMGPDSFAPGIFQALAALAEFGGGLAWILGLLTPLASLGIASTMAVAFSLHAVVRSDPFVSMTGGPSSELAAVYFTIALLLIALGPGRVSLDRMLFGPR
jgi:putative oxidoreductase